MNEHNEKKAEPWTGRFKQGLQNLFVSDNNTLNDHDENKAFEEIGSWYDDEVLTMELPDFQSGIKKEGRAFFNLGFKHGIKKAKPTAIFRAAKKSTLDCLNHSLSCLRRKRQESENEIAALTTKKSIVVNKQGLILDRRERIEFDFDHHPKTYNLSVGIFYLFVAAVMTFADLALSLVMAEAGFELYEPYEKWPFAFGVAFMTMYVKIMYDDYLAISSKRVLLNQRKDILLGKGVTATEEEQKLAEKIKITQFIFKLVIFILVIVAIVILAYYRLESKEMATAFADKSADLQTIIDNGGVSPVDTASIVPAIDTASVASTTSNSGVQASSTKYGLKSFIFITLVLPLIGGVCASIGLRNILNFHLREKTQKELDQIALELEGVENKITESTGINTFYISQVNDLETPAYFQDVYEYLIAYFKHGYHAGLVENTTGNLFDSAQIVREEYFNTLSGDLFTKFNP